MSFRIYSVAEHMEMLRRRRARIGPQEITWEQLARCFPVLTRYQVYLMSAEWEEKREQVRKRCGGICERCHAAPMQHVHHRTYVRVYRERATDLVGLCAACHAAIHGKSAAEMPADSSES